MRTIANPQELTSALERLLDYAGSTRPSRSVLASELMGLSRRTAAVDNQQLVDHVAKKLRKLADKYRKHNGADDSIGGLYYGGAAMRSFRFGGIDVMQDFHANGKIAIVGLKIGSNWFPFPPVAAQDAVLRSKYYQDREKLIKGLKEEAGQVLLPLKMALAADGQKTSIEWLSGSAWSAYFLAKV